MSLAPPSPRELSHTRTVIYRGYDREDGLWDIEAELNDIKSYTLTLPNTKTFLSGEPVHGLVIRLTIDKNLIVQDVLTSMDHTPHTTCDRATTYMHRLKGCQMGKGWRKQIGDRIGGTDGCTHLREMLFNMATVAFQTVATGEWHRREIRGQSHPPVTEIPPFINQCHTWASNSTTTQRVYPMFYQA